MSTERFCPHCGALNSPEKTMCFSCQQSLDPGSGASEQNETTSTLLFGRYRLLNQLGAGRFSFVYRAQDTYEQNGLVALKQITLTNLSAEEAIEATDTFHREETLLSALNHPQIPHVHNQLSDTHHWYLVVDFIEGQTLESYLIQKHGQLPATEALSIGLSLCSVLDYLHTREPPVIYRDLKPSNIMYTPLGQIFLIDFGIARRFKPNQKRDTIPFGSPGYAAPEQYGYAQTAPQSDIYSLGMLLYQLLSGRDPTEPSFEVAPLLLSGVVGDQRLNTLIQAMISPVISERPENINAVANELRRIQGLLGESPAWTPPPNSSLPSSPITSTPVSAGGNGQRQYYWPGDKHPQPAQQAQSAHKDHPRRSLTPQKNTAKQAQQIQQVWDKDAPKKWIPDRSRGLRRNPYYHQEKALWSLQADPLASSQMQPIIKRTRRMVLLIIGIVITFVIVIGLLIWLSSIV
jgi:serine/threonine protein kinase